VRRTVGSIASTIWIALAVATAHACPQPGHAWVRVVTTSPDVGDRVIRHLRAELAPRHIDVCGAPDGTPPDPVATVEILGSDAPTVGITVEVRDAITDKRVSREIDLATLPPDARPMAIAVGAAELLRSSWAEVALDTSREPNHPVPEGVRGTVDDAMHQPRAGSLGLLGAGEVSTGKLRQLGIDARFSLAVTPRLAVYGRVGARAAQTASTPKDAAWADAWVVGVGGTYAITPISAPLGFGVFVRADVVSFRLLTTSSDGAKAKPASGVTVLATAGANGWLHVSRSLDLVAEIGAGPALKGLKEVGNVTKPGEIVFSAGVGVAVKF
jgi:hypothetical protein